MKKQAFTLLEMLLVVILVGVLMISLFFYLGNTREKTLQYQAEACIRTLDGDLQTFLTSALTSKAFLPGTTVTSISSPFFPDSYSFTLFHTGFILMGKQGGATVILQQLGKDRCGSFNSDLQFFFTGQVFSGVTMNKGFSLLTPSDTFAFALVGNGKVGFTGQIQVQMKTPSEQWKDMAKWMIDARSHLIVLKKCLFYQEGNPNVCSTWEA